jgi:hypothetical protein
MSDAKARMKEGDLLLACGLVSASRGVAIFGDCDSDSKDNDASMLGRALSFIESIIGTFLLLMSAL